MPKSLLSRKMFWVEASIIFESPGEYFSSLVFRPHISLILSVEISIGAIFSSFSMVSYTFASPTSAIYSRSSMKSLGFAV